DQSQAIVEIHTGHGIVRKYDIPAAFRQRIVQFPATRHPPAASIQPVTPQLALDQDEIGLAVLDDQDVERFGHEFFCPMAIRWSPTSRRRAEPPFRRTR